MLPPRPVHHLFGEQLPHGDEHHQRQHPAEQERENGRSLLDLFSGEGHARFMQAIGQVRVADHGRFIHPGLVLVGEQNAVVLLLDLHAADLPFFGHGEKGAVIHLHDLPLRQHGQRQQVEQKQDQQHGPIIEHQRFLGSFYFIHPGSALPAAACRIYLCL